MSMKQLTVKTLSGMMIYTGDLCNSEALALKNRNYGASDNNAGTLQKNYAGNSLWSKYPSYIFVETESNYKHSGDILNAAYSYITIEHSDELHGTPYMDDNKEFNFIYTYETDLHSSFVNARKYPYSDITYFVSGLNEAVFNKQKYYNGNNEVSQIIYNTVKYSWYDKGTILKDAYTGEEHIIGQTFFTYNAVPITALENTVEEEQIQLIGYKLDANNNQIIGEDGLPESYTYTGVSYVISYTLNSDGRNYLSYETWTIASTNYLNDALKNDIYANIDKYLESYNIYDKEPLYAYYISKANTVLNCLMETYSLESKPVELMINYNSEYLDWFDNSIHINIDTTKLNATSDLLSITASDHYYFGVKFGYTDISTNNIELNKNESYLFTLTNKLLDTNDVIEICSPYKAKVIDLSPIKTALVNTVNLDFKYEKDINYKETKTTSWIDDRGTVLEQLIIGDDTTSKCLIDDIYGLENMSNLQLLDIRGCDKFTKSENFEALSNLHVLKANNSNIDNFTAYQGAKLYYVSLPNDLKTLSLKDVKFESGTIKHYSSSGDEDVEYDGTLNYTPNDNLISLTLENVNGIDTYQIVKTWIESMSTEIINSGLVNYISLKGVNWASADVNIILTLKKLGLDNFTGTINILGTGENQSLKRSEYIALKQAFGESVFTNSYSELKFTYKEIDCFYSVALMLTNGESTLPIIATFDKIKTSESLFDLLDINETTAIKSQNALQIVLPKSIVANNTYYPTKLTVGDILLYKGTQLYFVYNESTNIINNFVKLGTINSDYIDAFVEYCTNIDTQFGKATIKDIEDIHFAISITCDENISVTKTAFTIPFTQINSTVELPVTITENYVFDALETTNKNVTYTRNVLTIANINSDITISLKSKQA